MDLDGPPLKSVMLSLHRIQYWIEGLEVEEFFAHEGPELVQNLST